MLKKTLIAVAALSSFAVMIPAQAEDWGNGHREVHRSSSPSISFVIYRQEDRSYYHRSGHDEYRHYGHRQYDRDKHWQDRGRDHGWGHRQHRGYDHRGYHR